MITLEIDGGMAVATLCRPPVNAINEQWIAQFGQILDEVELRQEIRVIWIRSSERVFCAGADLALMRNRFESAEGRAQMIELTRAMQSFYERLERSPKVSIAEIGGAAMGGGLELALACDLRVMSEDARTGLPEARLGLLPGAGGTQRLARICGDAVARRLILSAEVVGGLEAVALGIAHKCAPAAELAATAGALAARIADLPGLALEQCKRCINATLDSEQNGFDFEISGTALLLESSETQRLVRDFLAVKNP